MTNCNWHEKAKLSDGTMTGKLGALTYVLDNMGKPISKGFHSISVMCDRMIFIGKIGARVEVFTLDKTAA